MNKSIGRANLNGTGVDQSFIAGAGFPRAVAVDALRPPNATIESAAINRDKRKARFTFSSSQPNSTSRCALDARAFRSCASPKTYKDLAKGRHTFKVKARNSQRADDPSPAKESFRI